ncbi:SSM4-like protein [Fusarium denticulatum]|uniref:SSM4-like protein n=1 Tax=Fusarium denticulatum TaxID=48507 RepID=A0A8H5XG73_9HYPO|nr:SSM4-like protein [Fusarium denticulatum]
MPGVTPSHSIVDIEVVKSLKAYQQQRAYKSLVTASNHSSLLAVNGNIGALFTITHEVVGFIFIGRTFTSGALADSITSIAAVFHAGDWLHHNVNNRIAMVKWFRRDPAVDVIFPKVADRIDEYYCADLLDFKSVTVMVPTEKGSEEVDAEDFNKEFVDIESSPEIIVT